MQRGETRSTLRPVSDTVGFWKLAEEDPDRLAVVDPSGREVTYGELFAESNRLVHGLRALGLTTGDGVAAVLPNGVEMFALYFAAMQAGWYLTPINHHLVGPEIAYIVQDCEAGAFIGHERYGDACADGGVGDRAAGGAVLRHRRRGRLPTVRRPGRRAARRSARGPLGRRRHALHVGHHRTAEGRAPPALRAPTPTRPPARGGFLMRLFGTEAHDGNVHICGSPLYHTAVLAFASTSLHLGHPVVLMDRWSPEGMLELIERHRVTNSHMVPTQFHRLLALPDEVRQRYDVSSLRSMVHAAAPCPVEIKQRMLDWWGPVIWEYYAATEGGGTVVSPEQWLSKPGTVGLPWPGAEIRIVDDEGEPQPAGEIGAVYLKLGQGDFEYFKDKGKTAANRLEGYFTVGDVGYLDEDGLPVPVRPEVRHDHLGWREHLPGRDRGRAAHATRSVADAAVFGIPHADWGEEIKAVVEPAPGVAGDDALTDELLSHCAERLARFKLPKSIDYTTEMPRDPNGKLYKRKLRDPYWEGQRPAI